MDDLISRQAAIDALRYAQHRFTVAEDATGGRGTVKWSEDVIYFATAKRVLDELPSAQPEIVRCKDCKFGNISSMGHLAVCGHEKGLVDPVPDSYCSYAERRTDE